MHETCDLQAKKCLPCEGGVPPLKGKLLGTFSSQVISWRVVGERELQKEFKFKNFAEALTFVNKVGEIAEQQGHHPDVFLAWGKVKITLWTHAIGGLSSNDFIMAAKIDEIK